MKKIASLVLLLINLNARAASCSANTSGNWGTPGTWSCGHVPAAGDNVTIGAGKTVTVNGNFGANIGNLDIYGTLAFTNGSKVNLSSASVVNIYSGGSITGGNGGAKLVFPTASYSGAFSTTGPYYYSNGSSGTGVLPLILRSFYCARQNQNVVLYWKTENEENINSFEIEASGNGNSDWQPVNSIPAMSIPSGGYSYSYIDQAKFIGNRFYRLKIVDKDGKYVYSKVLVMSSSHTAMFSVTPTLASQSIQVIIPGAGSAQISIYNVAGQMVKSFNTGTDMFNIDISVLRRGEYFLKVAQGTNLYMAKFLKQ